MKLWGEKLSPPFLSLLSGKRKDAQEGFSLNTTLRPCILGNQYLINPELRFPFLTPMPSSPLDARREQSPYFSLTPFLPRQTSPGHSPVAAPFSSSDWCSQVTGMCEGLASLRQAWWHRASHSDTKPWKVLICSVCASWLSSDYREAYNHLHVVGGIRRQVIKHGMREFISSNRMRLRKQTLKHMEKFPDNEINSKYERLA